MTQDFVTQVAGQKDGPSVRVRAVHVEVMSGAEAGLRARIDRPVLFIIGSGPTADLRLSDTTVSREHVRLIIRENGVHVRDPGSTNGTWIGNLGVSDIVIGAVTILRLGATTIRVHVEAAPLDVHISERTSFGGAIGVSAVMRHVFALLETAAPTDATVLLEGESGVGKEVLAQALHAASARADQPFVVVDCGALPPNLIESELFGHTRGSFTGADRDRVGAFQRAHGGTLFLDELGELPLDLQPKLLRFLETREVRPIGTTSGTPVDVRIVAATNRNLGEAARKDEFRRDLFYRLAVVRINIPPLRDRREDIGPIALKLLRSIPGHEKDELPPDFLSMLTAYEWPGNIRELRNAIDRYVVLGMQGALIAEHALAMQTEVRSVADLTRLPYHEARRIAVERFEEQYLKVLLERSNGVVTRAAELGELSRASIHRMLMRMRKAHGIVIKERDEDEDE